jgi:4-carboxymuconolactone decarboxylase
MSEHHEEREAPEAGRLPSFDENTATPEQRRVLDEIRSGPRGNLDGPFLSWIHSPTLADRAQRLGAFCRYDTGLPLRLSELAILVTAAHWRSQAEWHIHCPIALRAGLPAHICESIRTGQLPQFDDDDDRLIFEFVIELNQTKRVSETSYRAAVERFEVTTVINLVGLLGYYALVAMTLNVFEVRAVGQKSQAFPE